VLTSSLGHVPSQCTKSVHDLGHRVNADVEQLADQFSIRVERLVHESILIRTYSASSMIVGVAHAEPPGEVGHEVEIDAPVIADSSIKIINKRTSIVADATVVDILHEDEHGDRVRAAGLDPSAFRHINEAGEDVEVCRESLELRVLALDVLRVLDEDTLIRPKPVKANLGEHVNAEVVESERCSSKPVDALHHM